MTVPSYVATGTHAEGTGSVAPLYGANLAGDKFLLQVYVRNVTSAPNTPPGWGTLEGDATQGNSSHYYWIRDAPAAGTEEGSAVTITGVAGNCVIAAIHTFRNLTTVAQFESKTTGGSAVNDSSIEAPSVTTSGADRLALALGGCGENVTGVASFTGETGGDWVLRSSIGSDVGNNGRMWLQTADLASAGTISGGSMTISSAENWVQHGAAILAAEQQTRRRALLGVGS